MSILQAATPSAVSGTINGTPPLPHSLEAERLREIQKWQHVTRFGAYDL